jgi:hypothetical protein
MCPPKVDLFSLSYMKYRSSYIFPSRAYLAKKKKKKKKKHNS